MLPSHYFPTESMSEYQLEIRRESSHFHSREKGCKVRKRYLEARWDNGVVELAYCNTHAIDLCKCGWESSEQMDWHYNEPTYKNLFSPM
jgi:hypothetical protein